MLSHDLLARCADKLSGTTTGVWLHERLRAIQTVRTTPKVLSIISSSREANLVFPGGVVVSEDTVSLDCGLDDPAASELVDQVDLLLWTMSALRLFPAEYAAVLDRAIETAVPIWCLIVGVGRVGNREEFTKKVVPDLERRLPGGSRVNLVFTAGADLLGGLHADLARSGPMLISRGVERRLQLLTAQLRSKLNSERCANESLLCRLMRRYDTCRSGIEKAKVMTRAVASNLRNDWAPLMAACTEFSSSLLAFLEDRAPECSAQELSTELESRFKAVAHQIAVEKAESRKRLASRLRSWAEETSEELAALLSSDGGTTTNEEAIRNSSVDVAALLTRVEPVLLAFCDGLSTEVTALQQALSSDTLAKVLQLLGRDQGPGRKAGAARPAPRRSARGILGEPARRKMEASRLASVLGDAWRHFEERLPVLMQECSDEVRQALCEEIDTRAGHLLPLSARTMDDPRRKVEAIVSAERLLPRS